MRPREPAASLSVECLGLPGAGKSRLCWAATSALRRAGVVAELHARQPATRVQRLRTAAGVLALIARRPGYCWRSLLRIQAAHPDEVAWLMRTWLKRSAAARRQRRVQAVHLTDAGVAQALWSLAFRARSPQRGELLAALAEEAPLPALLLVLEANDDLLRERLASRPGADRKGSLFTAHGGALKRGRSAVEMLATMLSSPGRRRAALRVVHLKSRDENDLADNVETVRQLVGALDS